MAAGLAVLVCGPLLLFLLAAGIKEMVTQTAVVPMAYGKKTPRRLGSVKLLTAAALLPLPWVAKAIAERRVGWMDADGNGFQDPLVAGSNDWGDRVSAVWIIWWGALDVLVVFVAVVATVLLMRVDRPSARHAWRGNSRRR